MFKADVKKYKLFILCNLASISILYSFISISANKQFMNPSIVDPMISSNIHAPTIFVLVFMGIFIPYSQSVFIKARQKDYGILLSLGMTENEVRKSVLVENLLMCFVSLIIGLISGTLLSLFFLAFIRDVIGIHNIDITISAISYITTTIYVFVIFIISIIANIYGMVKSTIYAKIKYAEKTEIRSNSSIIFCYIGIIFTITAIIAMILFYHTNSNIWLLSMFFCLVGSFLIFFNGEALIEYFQNKCYKRYINNIFLFSDLKYYYSKNKKIFFANTWLFFQILFFVVLSLVNYPNLINNSIAYHPFHMAYSEIKGNFKSLGDSEFKPLTDSEVESIAQDNNNSIISNHAVSFIRSNAVTIFCIDDVNKVLKKNYKVQSNSLIYVHPYYMNDGYEHEDVNSNISSISINSNKGAKKYIIKDTIIDPLFGQINSISQSILLADKVDFDWIKSNGIEYYLEGKLHLYNFSNWRNSNVIVNKLSNRLSEKNTVEKGDTFHKVSSRIEAYDTALKSSNFLIFNIIYFCSLLYFAAIIMIHFKLMMEYKDEKKKYYSLYRIGTRGKEIRKMISQKMLVIYSIPLIYAIITNIVFSYNTFNSNGYGNTGVSFAIITSLVLLLVHLMVYKLYFNIYYKRIISDIGYCSNDTIFII